MVVVDTGASYISGPTSALRLLMETLGAKELSTNEVRSWGKRGHRRLREHRLIRPPQITAGSIRSHRGPLRALPSSPLSPRVTWCPLGRGWATCPALSSRGAQPQAQGCVCPGGFPHSQGSLYLPLSTS